MTLGTMRLFQRLQAPADDGAGGGAGGGGGATGDANGSGGSGDTGSSGGAGASANGGAASAGTTGAASTALAGGAGQAGAGAAGGAAGDDDKAGGATGAQGGDSGKAYWPEDWATRLAKGDDKRAAQIRRYASPEALADALIAAQARIRSGELRPVLAKDAKPEEIAAWRKDVGIPEKPDGYDLKFEDGLVIGKEDKPIVDGFLARAHESNLMPEQVKGVIQWYYKEQERQAEAREQQDESQRTATLDALNVEWGRDFRRNVNLIHSVLSRFPAPVQEALAGARMPDGTAVFNNPDVMRGFVGLALEVNPAGIVAEGGGGDVAKTMNDEIAQIEKWINSPRKSADGKKYWGSEETQTRYRQLLEMRGKLQQKAA